MSDQGITKTNGGTGTEVDMLLATGERLLRTQRDRLVAEKATYEMARTNLLNAYQANLAKLHQDTADAATALHAEHERKVNEIERLIAKLTAMQEA